MSNNILKLDLEHDQNLTNLISMSSICINHHWSVQTNLMESWTISMEHYKNIFWGKLNNTKNSQMPTIGIGNCRFFCKLTIVFAKIQPIPIVDMKNDTALAYSDVFFEISSIIDFLYISLNWKLFKVLHKNKVPIHFFY